MMYKNEYLKAYDNEGFVEWVNTLMESHNAYQSNVGFTALHPIIRQNG